MFTKSTTVTEMSLLPNPARHLTLLTLPSLNAWLPSSLPRHYASFASSCSCSLLASSAAPMAQGLQGRALRLLLFSLQISSPKILSYCFVGVIIISRTSASSTSAFCFKCFLIIPLGFPYINSNSIYPMRSYHLLDQVPGNLRSKPAVPLLLVMCLRFLSIYIYNIKIKLP